MLPVMKPYDQIPRRGYSTRTTRLVAEHRLHELLQHQVQAARHRDAVDQVLPHEENRAPHEAARERACQDDHAQRDEHAHEARLFRLHAEEAEELGEDQVVELGEDPEDPDDGGDHRNEGQQPRDEIPSEGLHDFAHELVHGSPRRRRGAGLSQERRC
jgi:hypothetical protein